MLEETQQLSHHLSIWQTWKLDRLHSHQELGQKGYSKQLCTMQHILVISDFLVRAWLTQNQKAITGRKK